MKSGLIGSTESQDNMSWRHQVLKYVHPLESPTSPWPERPKKARLKYYGDQQPFGGVFSV